MPYMVTFTINIPQMLAYIPYMDPMGNYTSQIHRNPGFSWLSWSSTIFQNQPSPPQRPAAKRYTSISACLLSCRAEPRQGLKSWASEYWVLKAMVKNRDPTWRLEPPHTGFNMFLTCLGDEKHWWYPTKSFWGCPSFWQNHTWLDSNGHESKCKTLLYHWLRQDVVS
jgi:hypothetical protein